ncbi:hypothetical protein M0R72_12240 [Candidatus Pacearchaeota archaeon]|nr:hypothetical protein [Candidatus Pacearchaeota archaeon]
MKCWKCPNIGKTGKDSRGDICWCLLNNLVRDPNIGCNYQDVKIPTRY